MVKKCGWQFYIVGGTIHSQALWFLESCGFSCCYCRLHPSFCWLFLLLKVLLFLTSCCCCSPLLLLQSSAVAAVPCCCCSPLLLLKSPAVAAVPCCCCSNLLLLKSPAVAAVPCCCCSNLLLLKSPAVAAIPCCCSPVLLLQSPVVAAFPCCCWRPLCSHPYGAACVLLLAVVGVLALPDILSFLLLVTSHASAPVVVGFSLLLLLFSCFSLLPLLLGPLLLPESLLLLVCLLLLASLLFLAFSRYYNPCLCWRPWPFLLLFISFLLLSF